MFILKRQGEIYYNENDPEEVKYQIKKFYRAFEKKENADMYKNRLDKNPQNGVFFIEETKRLPSSELFERSERRK